MRRGLALRPDFGEGHANLGLMLHALGRQSEAIACMRAATALEPNLAWVHANLGSMLYGARNFEDALQTMWQHWVASSCRRRWSTRSARS
jgi:Flp pilus assembly protein TadD